MSEIDETFRRIGVVGLGTMGAGIAYLAAYHGFDVIGVDTTDELANAAKARVRAFAEEGGATGKLQADDVDDTLGRIAFRTDLAAVHDCNLVIESVLEDPNLKAEILGSLAEVVAPDAVLATNTSSLSITELAVAVARPERFLGLHFFNPVPAMRLVEVVSHPATNPATTTRIVAFVTGLGKEVVSVGDRPGFLVNSVLVPYLNQALEELEAHLAEPEVVDEAVRLGLGYPVGPYQMLELIGLETQLRVAEQLYAQTHLPEMAPPAMLKRMIASQRLDGLATSTTGEAPAS